LKRGVSLDTQTSVLVESLAEENHVKWNRMVVIAIELGLPVFMKIKVRAPELAKALLLTNRYHYVKRRRGSEAIIQQIQSRQSERVKLDAIISAGVPSVVKEGIRREAKQRSKKGRKIPMSQVWRERAGVQL
jgi:hypothetical protein